MRRTHYYGLAAILFLPVLAGVYVLARHKNGKDLVLAAYARSRPLELRIHGAPYVPFTPISAEGSGRVSYSVALLEAEALLSARGTSPNPSRSELSQRGRLSLLEGNYERAISSFQQALAQDPNEPALLSDLAAAYYGRAKTANRFEDYGRAFELESKVLDAEPDNVAAIFNRALTAERLFLFQQSTLGWERYLELDSSSEWATEAQQSRDRVRRRVSEHDAATSQPLFTFREFAEKVSSPDGRGWDAVEPRIEDYLDVAVKSWLPTAFSSGNDEDSVAAKRSLHLLGRELEQVHGDRWLQDLLASPRGSAITDAITALSQSFKDSDNQDFASATANAQSAEVSFKAAGNKAGVELAQFEQAHAMQFADDGPNCQPLAASARGLKEVQPYIWIGIQLALEEGNCAAQQGLVSHSQKMYVESRQKAAQAKYPAIFLRAASFEADVAEDEGKKRQAWEQCRQGLQEYWARSLPVMRGYNFYFLLERMSAKARLWRLQIAIDGQGLELLQTEWPLFRAVLYSNSAHAALMLGDAEKAKNNYATAGQVLDHAPASASRDTYRNGLAMDLAAFEAVHGDPSEGLRQLKSVNKALQRVFNVEELERYFLTMSELAAAVGDVDGSVRDLQTASALLERQRSSIDAEALRLSWTRNADPVYRGLVKREAQASGAAAALADWEFLRDAAIRTNEPWKKARPMSVKQAPSDADDVRAMLRREQDLIGWMSNRLDGRTMLVYSLLDRRLAIWILDKSGAQLRWVDLDPAVLSMIAARFSEQCASANSSLASLRATGRQLYDVLIKPMADRIGRQGGLVIEADEALATIPFQALVDADGRYLSESHAIVYVPAVRYLAGLHRAADAITADLQPLVVAVSHGDAESHLLPLIEAVTEANDVARYFVHPDVLIEDRASLAELQQGLTGASVFHFVGHSRLTTERVQLLLRSGGATGSSEVLDVDSLGNAQMPKLQLAVLSACSTEWTPEGGLLDPGSLARAFLRAGVPHVVAARWNVNSSATTMLMGHLYREMLRGNSVSQALSLSEARVRDQYPHPYYWAGFDAFGEN